MKVVNRKPNGVPEGAVYVGRPSIFGNPFRIGPDGDRLAVVEKYRSYFNARIKADMRFRVAVEKLRTAEALACWCAPMPCHAYVIAEYLDITKARG